MINAGIIRPVAFGDDLKRAHNVSLSFYVTLLHVVLWRLGILRLVDQPRSAQLPSRAF